MTNDGGLCMVAGIMIMAVAILIWEQRKINAKMRKPKYRIIRGVWTRTL